MEMRAQLAQQDLFIQSTVADYLFNTSSKFITSFASIVHAARVAALMGAAKNGADRLHRPRAGNKDNRAEGA